MKDPETNRDGKMMCVYQDDCELLRLAAIVAYSEDAILSKDMNGMITDWNSAAERMYGYTAEEMVGTPVLRLIPEERIAEYEQIDEALKRGESLRHFETERIAKDGKRLHVALTLFPIRDLSGKMIGACAIGRDITAQKRSTELLIQAEQVAANARLAGAISHEINSPLQAATNALYLMDQQPMSAEVRELLDIARAELQRVGEMVRRTMRVYQQVPQPRSSGEQALADNAENPGEMAKTRE